jgi:osmoprotectant transport system substrate-binding protein
LFSTTRLLTAALLVVGLVTASCSTPRPERTAPVRDPAVVVVGTFDFPESELLGELFVQALQRVGITADRRFRIGSREVVEPALEQGLVDVVPEYLASASQFLTLGEDSNGQPIDELERLREVAAARGLTVLEPSAAVNRNAIAMRADVAADLGVRSVLDLRHVGDLDFVGPPECPERPACVPLLRELGIEFRSFTPLPPGEPIALALAAGEVEVGLMFSTDPLIDRHALILLDGRVGFDRAEQLVPMVRSDTVEGHGARLVDALDRVMAELTTPELARLNGLVADGASAEQVASEWLDAHPAP